MAVTPLPPERRRQLTRDTLIDAAAEVFARRGIHAASLDEIAAAAGFTRGAIYSNFGGKDELLLAVVARQADRTLAAMWEAYGEAGPDHIVDATDAAATWRRLVASDEQMLLLRLELRLHALRNPAFRDRLAELQRDQLQQATDFLVRRSETIGFEFRVPAEEIADLLIVMTDGLLQHAAVEPERQADYDHLFERFVTLVIAAGVGERSSTASAARKA